MPQMRHTLLQNHPNMLIVQRIEHGLPLPTEADKVRRLQNAQLVTDRRLRQIQQTRNIAHAQLALKEHIEDLDARRIAKNARRANKLKSRDSYI